MPPLFKKTLLTTHRTHIQRILGLAFLSYSWTVFAVELPQPVFNFLENHCLDCHDSSEQKGDLNLEELSFDLSDPKVMSHWVLIHDRVQNGEMPPKKKRRPEADALTGFVESIADPMIQADRDRITQSGRAKVRRLNRLEYENALKHILNAPWLQVADRLPEDGTEHLFNKIGERLDVSHIQMAKYLETAEFAIRAAVDRAAYPSVKTKHYAREEDRMLNYLKYRRNAQTAPTRAAIPLLGLTPQPEVIRGNQPVTVGESNPALRELEALGFVSGTYTATTKYDFNSVNVPIDGEYRLRMKTYTFMAGPNGRRGGNDNGLTGGDPAWWRPDRNVAFAGKRSEPITLYALSASQDSRWLTTFDSYPEPQVIERVVTLKKGETIRPDAGRLVRTRPGWKGNPNATQEGVPGFALNWLEMEGPLSETWPPDSYKAIFDDLPFEVDENKRVSAISKNPEKDAQRLILRFMRQSTGNSKMRKSDATPYFGIFKRATELETPFTDAVISACASTLCSPDFLYFESQPGRLDNFEIANRLSYFLWNGPPDEDLLKERNLRNPSTLSMQADRMLEDPKSERFINAFLDYWLDLRKINANTPDAELYPDYYLDDQLTEASLLESRLFFRELLDLDLPIRNLVDSDFTFVNERLARHYGLEPFEGVQLRRVDLPEKSPRGGVLTQASVLRVTANGTTTSPVVRGTWVMERILGVHIPPPPSGVEAVEPDTRGATTIREQLDLHRESESCNACHVKIDPAGFALESFDVAGGWRERYRAIGDIGDTVEGLGKNGHAFVFREAEPVDPSGEFSDGSPFQDINELKSILLRDERVIARNFAKQLIVYATGAPVSFSDRSTVETILDAAKVGEYGTRSLIHEVIKSDIFKIK